MSFLRSLFGLGEKSSGKGAAIAREAEHNGYMIEAVPYKEQGQYQVAGVITKDIDGQRREYKFVRADRFGSLEAAADFTILKARQIIDQQGDRLFG